MLTDASGHRLPIERPRALLPAELARLKRIGMPEKRECDTRFYEFGCPCDACLVRSMQAEEYGYDHAGRLVPPPSPPQPWQPRRAA